MLLRLLVRIQVLVVLLRGLLLIGLLLFGLIPIVLFEAAIFLPMALLNLLVLLSELLFLFLLLDDLVEVIVKNIFLKVFLLCERGVCWLSKMVGPLFVQPMQDLLLQLGE